MASSAARSRRVTASARSRFSMMSLGRLPFGRRWTAACWRWIGPTSSRRSPATDAATRRRVRWSGGACRPLRLARPRPGSVAELDALDHLGRRRTVAGAGLGLLDRVHGVHPLGHLAEDRVLAVEPGSGLGGDDEELGSVGVRPGV